MNMVHPNGEKDERRFFSSKFTRRALPEAFICCVTKGFEVNDYDFTLRCLAYESLGRVQNSD